MEGFETTHVGFLVLPSVFPRVRSGSLLRESASNQLRAA